MLDATRGGDPRSSEASACEGDALQLDNGSGLSRTERISARNMGRLLTANLSDLNLCVNLPLLFLYLI